VLRLVYTDGSTGTVEPSGPYVVQGGQVGAAVSNPYDNASLRFAGTVGLVVKAKQGGWTELNRDVLDPLRKAGVWQTDDVVVRFFRALGTGGYVARVDVLTQRCRGDVLNALAGSPQVRSKVDRYVEVEYAFSTVQAAIDAAADGATVTIPPGRYRERIDFKGKKITLRSSNPGDAAVVAATVIDGSGGAPVVRFGSGETAQSVLDGFTVTGGAATAGSGGGVAVLNASSPTIRRCVVEANSARASGGGIHVTGKSQPLIEENTIRRNEAGTGGGGVCSEDASPTMRGNRIVENRATSATNLAGMHGGGGIACHGPGEVSVTGNTLEDNRSFVEESSQNALGGSAGGGLLLAGHRGRLKALVKGNRMARNTAVLGGGIGVEGRVAATVEENQIQGNRAGDGGGIAHWASPEEAEAPTVFWANVIEGNRAEPWPSLVAYTGLGSGGGIFFSQSHPELRANTFRANGACDGSAVWGQSILKSGAIAVVGNTFEGNVLVAVGGESLGTTVALDVRDTQEVQITLDTSGNTFSGNEGPDWRVDRKVTR
jgi:hypothetical protein